MSIKVQQWCVWTAIGMIAIWMVGFVFFAGFVPPPSPEKSAREIADVFLAHPNEIRFGLLLTALASALLGPFFAVVSVQMHRIEGRHAPLAYIQAMLGSLLILEFIFPIMILQACAYRADRDPNVIQALDDIAWFMFVGVVSTAALQAIAIAVAILRDTRETPVFPRWVGYANLWMALLLCPGCVCVFFKTGPFAWNGIFAWWVPLSAFSVWLIGMTVMLLKAIKRQEIDEQQDEDAVAEPDEHVRRQVDALFAAHLAEHRAEFDQRPVTRS